MYYSDSSAENNTERPKCFVYIPETFHPPASLTDDEQDCARYFMHIIECRRVFYRIEEPFVPLKAKYLQDMLGKDQAKKVRDTLEEAGDIEVNHKYIKGEQSKGHRLNDQYKDDPYRRVEITTPRLQRSIIRWRHQDHIEVTQPVHLWLRKWLHRVNFDFNAAVQLVENKEQMLHCLSMNDPERRFSVCKYGRVHTNITNMARHLRKCLTFNECQLHELDLVNSQPFFLGLVLLSYYRNGKKIGSVRNVKWLQSLLRPAVQECAERQLPPHQPLHYDRNLFYLLDTHEIMATLELLGGFSFPEDVRHYLDIACRGRLYETFQDNGMSRDEAKDLMFKVLFGKTKCPKFQEMFPHVWDFVTLVKKKDYRHLAHLLQRTESFIMIDTICGRLLEKYPGLPVLTIHDSILTTRPDLVQAVMRQEFANIGLIPTWKDKI